MTRSTSLRYLPLRIMACAFTVFSPLAFCLADSSTVQPAQSEWTPSPTLLTKLDTPFTLDIQGTIRPPLGYTAMEKDSPDGAGKVYNWTGPAGVKGYTPSLDVLIAVPPPGDTDQTGIDDVMASLVLNFHQGKSNWKLSNAHVGNIGGDNFHHVVWSGLDASRKLNIHGDVYGTKLANGTFILITCEDAEPDSNTIIPLLETSALTFVSK